jgi:hypothetical protein
MAIIKNIKCNECGFQLLWGSGAVTYVRLSPGFIRKLFGMKGKKIFLKEPSGGGNDIEVAGKDIATLIEEGRIEHDSKYICLSCLHLFSLDSESPKLCSKCKSSNVRSVFEMVGKKCPRCLSGIIEEKIVGIS